MPLLTSLTTATGSTHIHLLFCLGQICCLPVPLTLPYLRLLPTVFWSQHLSRQTRFVSRFSPGLNLQHLTMTMTAVTRWWPPLMWNLLFDACKNPVRFLLTVLFLKLKMYVLIKCVWVFGYICAIVCRSQKAL